MSKNVIYQIDLYHLAPKPFYFYEALANHTMPSMERYAKKIRADYIRVTDLPSGLSRVDNHYPRCCAAKFYLFRDFLKTDYDRLVIVDCDMFVNEQATNIFNEYPSQSVDFSACKLMSNNNSRHAKEVKIKYNRSVEQFYNGGIYLSGRKAAKLISNSIPENIEDYIGDFTGALHEEGSDGKYIHDQHFLGYVLDKENISVSPMNQKWNYNWGIQGKPKKQSALDKAYFVHYAGSKGKDYLIKTMEKK